MEKRALLIEFDVHTGKRAGDISPRDPNLRCYGWQDLKSEPAREIRLVEDDRDLSRYEGVPGVTVLHNEVQINKAIDDVVPKQFKVTSEALLIEHIRQKGINLDDYIGMDDQEILKDLLEKKKLIGIRQRSIRKLKES